MLLEGEQQRSDLPAQELNRSALDDTNECCSSSVLASGRV
jgi:hypothetical protein